MKKNKDKPAYKKLNEIHDKAVKIGEDEIESWSVLVVDTIRVCNTIHLHKYKNCCTKGQKELENWLEKLEN